MNCRRNNQGSVKVSGSKRCIDEFVRSKQVKAEVKYMQTWEEKILIKQEGIAEGRLEGKLEEKQELTRKLANKFSIEQIAEMLEIDISEVENILKESQNGK